MMKKVVLFCLCLLPLLTFAQFNKGQVYLGGTMFGSIQNSGNTSSKSSTLSVSPIVGYFLNPRLVLGGSVGYSSTTSKSEFVSSYYDANNDPYTVPGYVKSQTNSVSISSFVRYYIPISKSFYFAAQGQFSFSRANSTNTNFNNGTQGEQTTKTPSYTFGPSIRPVLIFFPSAKWSVEASIGTLTYSHARNLSNTNSSNAASFSAGSLSFGLAYYFKRTLE